VSNVIFAIMDKILYEEIVLLPVAKADFEKLNELAENLLLQRHPKRKDIIKEDRAAVQEIGEKVLKDYRLREETDLVAYYLS
jgi:hypothetical protein